MENKDKNMEADVLKDEALTDVTGGTTELKVGDKILISKYSGSELEIDGNEYKIP